VKAFADALVRQLPRGGLTPDALARVESDAREIGRFFGEFASPAKVAEGLEPLDQFRRVLACEAPDDFVECFQFMLASQQRECLLKPADVGLLAGKRADVSRADAAMVQRECEKVWAEWTSGVVVRAADGPVEEEDAPESGPGLMSLIKSPFRRMLGRAEG